MRLARHVVRDFDANKRAAIAATPKLFALVDCHIGATEVLNALFADNEMVDAVDDQVLQMFVDKIRHGRQARLAPAPTPEPEPAPGRC